MNINDYQKETERTSPAGDFEKQMLNYSMGISGESGELLYLSAKRDSENSKQERLKECGDIMWYCSRILHIMSYKYSDVIVYEDIDEFQKVKSQLDLDFMNIDDFGFSDEVKVSVLASEITDNIKKSCFQGHQPRVDLIFKNIYYITLLISRITLKLGFTMSEVLEQNLDKLRKRYPEGFSAEKSVNRKD